MAGTVRSDGMDHQHQRHQVHPGGAKANAQSQHINTARPDVAVCPYSAFAGRAKVRAPPRQPGWGCVGWLYYGRFIDQIGNLIRRNFGCRFGCRVFLRFFWYRHGFFRTRSPAAVLFSFPCVVLSTGRSSHGSLLPTSSMACARRSMDTGRGSVATRPADGCGADVVRILSLKICTTVVYEKLHTTALKPEAQAKGPSLALQASMVPTFCKLL